MARPTCFLCSKQLMYVKGKPVWAIVVIDGIEHRVHKDCKKYMSERFDTDAKSDVECALKDLPRCEKRIRTEP